MSFPRGWAYLRGPDQFWRHLLHDQQTQRTEHGTALKRVRRTKVKWFSFNGWRGSIIKVAEAKSRVIFGIQTQKQPTLFNLTPISVLYSLSTYVTATFRRLIQGTNGKQIYIQSLKPRYACEWRIRQQIFAKETVIRGGSCWKRLNKSSQYSLRWVHGEKSDGTTGLEDWP